MDKVLRYRIYGIVDIDPEYPSEIGDVVDRIREYGTASIVDVELLENDAALPDVDEDFRKTKAKRQKRSAKNI